MKFFFINLINMGYKHIHSIIFIIALLESLAIIGFFLPGMFLMGSIGILIGANKVNFYHAWFYSFLGCIIGDTISYFIGQKFKKKLFFFLKKYDSIINKIKKPLIKYNKITILIGKIIGPFRPIIPIMSGILDIPFKNFFIIDLLACCIWPMIYFIPGIFTYFSGQEILNLQIKNQNSFLLIFGLIIINILLIIIFFYFLINTPKKVNNIEIFQYNISKKNIFILLIFLFLFLFLEIFLLHKNPQKKFLSKIVKHVLLKNPF